MSKAKKKSNKKGKSDKEEPVEISEMELTEGQEADEQAWELAGCPDGWK